MCIFYDITYSSVWFENFRIWDLCRSWTQAFFNGIQWRHKNLKKILWCMLKITRTYKWTVNSTVNISLMSFNHLLRFAKTTDHSVYKFNIHFLNNFLTIEMLCLKDYQQNLYAELLSKAWSKNLTCNQINISLILMRLT